MDNKLIKTEQQHGLVIQQEQHAILIEERFKMVLSTLLTDVDDSHHKTIMAFNRVFDRESKQHHRFEIKDFSYISGTPVGMLANNNIVRGVDKARVLSPTVYVIIDEKTEDVSEHLKNHEYPGFFILVYINIPDYMAYTSMESYIQENHKNVKIISLNNAPPSFKANEHYHYEVSKTFVLWIHEFPVYQDDKAPFLTWSGFGHNISKANTCLYGMIEQKEFFTDARVAETAGLQLSRLILDWNPHIKTITEYIDDCASIENYPIRYKHMVRFVGILLSVDLELEFDYDLLSGIEDIEKGKREYSPAKNIKGFKVTEPTIDQLKQALLINVKYTKERLFVYQGKLCYAFSVKPKYYMRIKGVQDLFEGTINIEETRTDNIDFITPIHGAAYESMTKKKHLVIPSNTKNYIIRQSGGGKGWWSKHNVDHQIALDDLLEMYTLDKLISLKIYDPVEGFSASTYTLNMKNTRWFE